MLIPYQDTDTLHNLIEHFAI